MKRVAAAVVLAGFAASARARADDDAPGGRVYQIRTYFTAPGKLGVLLERFEAHNLAIFARSGVKLEGAWTPLDAGPEGERLVYLVSFPSREAADKAWAAFGSDAEWKRVAAEEKQTHGTVVTRAETVYLEPTDYSPVAAHTATAEGSPRIYEMRTYTASPGKLANLNARFREHTTKLFEKHGMTNVLYTEPATGEPGAGETLVYWLSFPSKESADASWKGFREDPQWQAVLAASQADGVKLAAVVKSVFLVPASFSPLK